MRKAAQMERLLEMKERLAASIGQHQRAIEAIQNQIIGIDHAIRAMNLAPGAPPPPRRNVKRTVLEVVQEAGKAGVTTTEVVERAAAKGRQLNANSVASLLSRFKTEGTFRFDGERYYLAAPVAPPEPTLTVVKAANGG